MNSKCYILNDNNEPIRVGIEEWGQFFETKKRFLLKDQKNNIIVSTVFLGLDHNFETGPPILFESMAFDNGNELDCFHYATYNEAIEGHKELCHQYEIYFIGTKEDVINSIDDLQK